MRKKGEENKDREIPVHMTNHVLTDICKAANKLGFQGEVITEVICSKGNVELKSQKFTGDLLKQIQDATNDV